MLFLVSLSLTGWTSYCLTACLRLTRPVDNVLALWLTFLAQIILETLGLSLLISIHPAGYLLAGCLVAAMASLGWRLQGCPMIQAGFADTWLAFRKACLQDRRLLALTAVLSFLALAHLLLTLGFVSKIHDSLTYHLSRAVYWLQHGTLSSFPTHNLRQTIFPPNSSITFLWSMTLLRSDRLVGLTSLCAFGVTAVAIWGICRKTGAGRKASAFAVLLWASFPENLQQSSVAADHFLACALAVVAVYFGIQGLAGDCCPALLLSSMSVGICIGVKFLAFFSGAAIGIGIAVLAFKSSRTPFKALALWGGAALFWAIMAGSPIYFENRSVHGDPFGGSAYDAFRVRSPNLRTLTANVMRCGYQFVDFTGPFYLDRPLNLAEAKVFTWLGKIFDFNPPGSYAYHPFVPENLVRRRSADTAWFGPLCFGVLVPCWVAAARRNIPFARILLGIAGAYSLLLLTLLTWNPWLGRFFTFPVALGAPYLAVFWESSGRRVLKFAIIGLAVMSILNLLINDPNRSLWGEMSVWRDQRDGVRFQTLKQYGKVVADLDRSLNGRQVRLGLMVGPDDPDYIFFDREFRRELVPVPISSSLPEGLMSRVDGLLVAPARRQEVGSLRWREVSMSEGWTLYLK